MEKEILEKNKQYLKKLYFWWLEYFDTWNLSDYDESSLSYNEFINTVNIIYSKNLITKSSRNRLLRINEKKKANFKW